MKKHKLHKVFELCDRTRLDCKVESHTWVTVTVSGPVLLDMRRTENSPVIQSRAAYKELYSRRNLSRYQRYEENFAIDFVVVILFKNASIIHIQLGYSYQC